MRELAVVLISALGLILLLSDSPAKPEQLQARFEAGLREGYELAVRTAPASSPSCDAAACMSVWFSDKPMDATDLRKRVCGPGR